MTEPEELARQLRQVETAIDTARYESTDAEALARLTARRDELVRELEDRGPAGS